MGLKPETAYALGIDVGGTNIKAGLVDSQGRVLSSKVIPTFKGKGYGYILKQLEKVINVLQSSQPEKIQGIGLALPGAVDDKRGLCLYCPNLGWGELEISKALTERTGIPVRLVNDANAACLSEYFYGGGQGTQNFLSITLGTGVGSGLILDGRLFTGLSGSGVEAGHMIIEPFGFRCNCGRRGCWETLVSAPGIVRRTIEKMDDIKESWLSKKMFYSCHGNNEDKGCNCQSNNGEDNRGNAQGTNDDDNSEQNCKELTTEMIFQAFREGDPLAQSVVEETISYLALGLTNLINLFNPRKISVGGGIAEAEEIINSQLFDQINSNIFPTLKDKVEIYKSVQGYYGGIVGAASLWFREVNII